MYRHRQTKIIYFTGMVCLLSLSTALAEEKYSVVDEIVVSATKDEKKLFDLATPMEVVTSEEIEKNTPVTPGQALERTPGVSVATSGIWTINPTIRGLGTGRTLVLVDGDRESNNIWRQTDPMAPIIDMGQIERIEVIKGPSSVLYGSDALGGVINVITKMPDFAFEDFWTFNNVAKTLYSSVDNGWYGRYGLSGGGKGSDFLLAVSGRDNENYKDGDGTEVNNSQFKNMTFDLKARHAINDNHIFALAARINNIDDMGVTFKPNSPYFHYTKYDNQSYKISYDGKEIGFLDSLHFKTFYTKQERDVDAKVLSGAKPVYTLKNSHADSDSTGINLHSFTNIGDSHRLLTGTSYSHETSSSNETLQMLSLTNNKKQQQIDFEPIPDANTDLYGIFGQDEIFIGDRLNLTLGLRYDYIKMSSEDLPFDMTTFTPQGQERKFDIVDVSEEEFDAITYNAGLLYELTPEIHLTANTSSGFRTPTVMELYAIRWGAKSVYWGNPELNPEKSYNYDLGAKFNSRTFRGMVNTYYNRVEDFIERRLSPNEMWMGKPKEKYLNITDAELYGFEVSAEHDFLTWLTLFGNLAYVQGQDRDSGDYLYNIPPLNGLAGLRFHMDKNSRRYWLELEGHFFDSQTNTSPGEDETSGYALCNIRTGVKLPVNTLVDNLTLTLNIENLFDKTYQSHLKVKDTSSNAPGLNIMLGLKVDF